MFSELLNKKNLLNQKNILILNYTLITFFTVLIIGPVINTLTGFILLFLVIIICFRKIEYFKIKKIILFSLIIIVLKNILDTYEIKESHNLILNNKDIKKIEKILDKEIINEIKKQLNLFYQKQSKDLDINDLEIVKKKFEEVNIDQPYAFSLDYQKNKKINFSRFVKNIDFHNIETLKLGTINQNKYSFSSFYDFDRSNLPFFVKYEFSDNLKNSKICWNGYIFIKYKDNQKKILNNKEFSCSILENSKFPEYIVGIKIIENLKMELIKNNQLFLFDNIIMLLKILFIILLFFSTSIKYEKFSLLIFLSFSSCILFILIFDPTLLTSMNILKGGGDGLVLWDYGRQISEHIYNHEYFSAFMGGERVYNFTPGIRYFFSLQSYLFGETMYGYVLIAILLPIILFKFLNIYFSYKYSFFLILSFLFFPIFERYAFGYFNYIRELVRLHSEVLGFVVFLSGYYFSFNCFKKINYLNLIGGFFFGLTCIIRPDYSLACVVFLCMFAFQKYKINKLFFIFYLLSASIILIMPLHNYIFGNVILLTTIASTEALKVHPSEYFYLIKNLLTFNIYDPQNFRAYNQIKGWNSLSDFHRVIIFLFINFSFFKKIKLETRFFILSAVLQQSLLFFYHSGGRQSYFAWFLVFISFLLILKDLKYFKYLHNFKLFKKYEFN